ncbi:ergothioneine biosynthesis protein EgtB [Oleiagrimonas sp. C23AA]|uniref:ergothioneine biosynthesis protein EgtB n=1 Tax=Oleiagrimonas sp. C23AA TaxID=2719047 RepID=UPI0014225DDE|nr:ergothioneine biosynthesis protein EgtB [Oleiagrimonas sp. C23AA]NII09076.1 ergothioneine biosynthesis protein EgtB [Oleiagrimonas sp. C23AA]
MNALPNLSATMPQPAGLGAQYTQVRQRTAALCEPLSPEDTVVQSMPDASPAKWHLAHTTWFFEQFILSRREGFKPFRPRWDFLFNSYYQSVGPMHARPQRGLLSRPSLREVMAYRAHVDAAMAEALAGEVSPEVAFLVTLGLNHEQQHQELLLTDIKHLLSINPLQPAYRDDLAQRRATASPLSFVDGHAGVIEAGHAGVGFAYDNEGPRHPSLLHPHQIAQRPVTNAEYRQFIDEGGYRTPTLWMAEGWDVVQRQDWAHPLYWSDDLQSEFTLGGRRDIDPHAPVCHVSYFEADAFARWAGARLPREDEWEHLASAQAAISGNFQDDDLLQPMPADEPSEGVSQLFGDVWEWTSSPYVSYPGFKPLEGALGEYNGKFMCGQWVLRGGSCATPVSHIRATYRNFFYPADRWQFMGIRLGRDVS